MDTLSICYSVGTLGYYVDTLVATLYYTTTTLIIVVAFGVIVASRVVISLSHSGVVATVDSLYGVVTHSSL